MDVFLIASLNSTYFSNKHFLFNIKYCTDDFALN